LNRLMSWILRTPGIQRLAGRSTALLTFVGRNSGKRYTTPISYSRTGDRVVLTCHRSRQWWRNLASNPRVRLRLAGKDLEGLAAVAAGDIAIRLFLEFLPQQRMIARTSGVSFANGTPNTEQAAAALQYTVVVSVELDS
jgi:deazaflavin-dependent oxidoreductase (nitroreductase family)